MGNLRLSFASAVYDRMQAIYTGEVVPEGIDLTFIAESEPRKIFDRMSGGLEFDACEYSLSEYIQRFAAGQCPYVAIPVFPSRVFRHGFIAVRRDKGIKVPADLAGRRIGVPLYTMTAAVFIRGLLATEYGVDLSGVKWIEGAMNTSGSHGSPTVLPLLKPADIEPIDPRSSLSDLLEAGEIDATIGTSLPAAIRSNPDIVRLFPDYVDIEKDYYRRTKIFPIMHTVAIKKEVYERYPFVVSSLYQAFCRAKKLALKRMLDLRALQYMNPWLMRDIDEIDDVFAGDPWPYGVEPNRPTIEALIGYLVDQSMISSKVDVDDLFIHVYR